MSHHNANISKLSVTLSEQQQFMQNQQQWLGSAAGCDKSSRESAELRIKAHVYTEMALIIIKFHSAWQLPESCCVRALRDYFKAQPFVELNVAMKNHEERIAPFPLFLV